MKDNIETFIKGLNENNIGSILAEGLVILHDGVKTQNVDVEDRVNRKTLVYPFEVFMKKFIEGKEVSLKEEKMVKVISY